MPVLRVGDEEERGNQGGVAEMALRELRDVLRPPQRHLGTRPRGLHLLAAVEEGLAGRLPGRGRTFRRRTAAFWGGYGRCPKRFDEVHRVVFVDGIWVTQSAVVLIACTERHVLFWHLARAETSAAWRSLLSRVAPPDVVVTDGGSKFAKAVAAE